MTAELIGFPVLPNPFWKLIQVDRETVEQQIEDATNRFEVFLLMSHVWLVTVSVFYILINSGQQFLFVVLEKLIDKADQNLATHN